MQKDEKQQDIYQEIRDSVKNQLDYSKEVTEEEITELIDETILKKSRKTYIQQEIKVQIADHIMNSLRKLDILQPLLDDPTITEIMVNGYRNIFIEQVGELRKTNLTFSSQQKLEDLIQNIVSNVNRVVNEGKPICDARLSDGSRVNVVMPPIALNGPILTIRKFSKELITIDQLIQFGTLSEEVSKFLEQLVKAKYNIFISGGTGSGKTTLLNILSNFIPKEERIITIEDSAELQIKNISNLVSLETRKANFDSSTKINIRDLIKTALRMRPDRIIVGEVRGVEAIDMLQAMNTGHDGSLSTGHANSTRDMLSRLETMILTDGKIPIEAIRKQVASSIDIIIHLGKLRDRSRRILEISEIGGLYQGEIHLNTLFQFQEHVNTTKEKVVGTLKKTSHDLENTNKLKMAGVIDWGD